ncbi:para-nitrobenzyl esterase isoform X1 [Synchiropus splendidus]|uniref:para-nitrobenzyl esterase isoform X1 n=1 Tax=Synchiropus splendidus TaxID=270530 RepID=UPI00237E2DBC|nr:para-nitrobenzyl esterase isoform X1 [Synchiropus splendidus]
MTSETLEYQYLVQEEEDERCTVRRHRFRSHVVFPRYCRFLSSIIVLLLLALATFLGYRAGIKSRRGSLVTTDCGVYMGQHRNGAYSFKGMRYAAPPVGDLRWAPPTDPECSSGVTSATDYGSVCSQLQPLSSDGLCLGQEDCLFINVWTPTLSSDAKIPVVVWIHGGYLQMLSGGEEGYSPTEKLAADTGLVYISFNYRLNAFGFLALEALRGGNPKNTSGNYGFMDQIAALKWVQRNIHAFGGDPGKVTIMGQSSGGTSVWVLMMSPLAKGLFHAAVDMSGSSILNATQEQAESDNLVFLRKTGCSDAVCLRSLSVKQVLQAIPWQEYPSWAADDATDLPTRGRFNGPVIVVDGYVLEAPPFEAWEKKMFFNDVPFIVGTTEQESDFSPPAVNMSDWTWADYQWFVTEKLQSFSEDLPKKALELYPSSAPCPTTDRCQERSFTTMVSDLKVTCPNNDLAGKAADALQSPVYRYVVTYTPSRAANVVGSLLPFPSRFSFHLLDSLAFFGGLEMFFGSPLSPQDKNFQDLITRRLVHFVKTGQMESDWPEYPAAMALLSTNFTVVNNYSADRCSLWKETGLLAYAWIN